MIAEKSMSLTQLEREFPREDFPANSRAKAYPLHYLLIYSPKIALKWIKKGIHILDVDEKTKKTPLMIAAALGNKKAVTLLLNYQKVKKTVLQRDWFGSHALGYAKGNVRNRIAKSCYLPLKQMDESERKIAALSLKTTFFGIGNKWIPASSLSAKEIESITGIKEWRDISYFPEEMKKVKKIFHNVFFYMSEEKKERTFIYPKLRVTVNQTLKNTDSGKCLGVFAHEPILPFTLLGAYANKIDNREIRKNYFDLFDQELAKRSSYIFNSGKWGGGDASSIGNALSRVNCGYPNTVVIPLKDIDIEENCLFSKSFIKEGEEVLICYPFENGLEWNQPFAILGIERLNKDFENGLSKFYNSFNFLNQMIKKNGMIKKNFIRLQSIIQKLSYCFNFPLVLLYLHYTHKVPISSWGQISSECPDLFKVLPFSLLSLTHYEILKSFVLDFDLSVRSDLKFFEISKDWILAQIESGKCTAFEVIKGMQLLRKKQNMRDKRIYFAEYHPLKDKECILQYNTVVELVRKRYEKLFADKKCNEDSACELYRFEILRGTSVTFQIFKDVLDGEIHFNGKVLTYQKFAEWRKREFTNSENNFIATFSK